MVFLRHCKKPRRQNSFWLRKLWNMGKNKKAIISGFILMVLLGGGFTVDYFLKFLRQDKSIVIERIGVNPNIAPAAKLALLEGVGPYRANQIVDYRQSFVKNNPGQQAFETPLDLVNIKGIGVKTVAKIERYLIFN